MANKEKIQFTRIEFQTSNGTVAVSKSSDGDTIHFGDLLPDPFSVEPPLKKTSFSRATFEEVLVENGCDSEEVENWWTVVAFLLDRDENEDSSGDGPQYVPTWARGMSM